MTTSTSLIDLILNLLRDPEALAAFKADPTAFTAQCGDFGSADVQDALVLLQDNQDADFSRDHNTGGNHIQVPPAPKPEPGESEHHAAVRYLDTFVTNNYIDDRDTIVDNSVNQQVDTGGGDFDQEIDVHSTVASGDGAVAAGGDITDSTITTGDDNQVGDGIVRGNGNVVGHDNQAVTGNGNTASFGSGDANSNHVGGDLTVGDGTAFATGGNAAVDNSDNSTNDSFNSHIDQSTHDSFNDSSDNSTNDSFNADVNASTHDSGNDNSDNSLDHSLNDNSDNSDHSDHSDNSDNSDHSDHSIDIDG